MIELVQQRGLMDCGVACLAMITGKSYEEIVKDFPDSHKKGMKLLKAQEWLEDHGFEVESRDWSGMPIELAEGLVLGAARTGRWDRHHAVVYCDGKVYDPSPFPYDNYLCDFIITIRGFYR